VHLGLRTTSPVKGSHKEIKSYLKVSTGDLYGVGHKLRLYLAEQHSKYKGDLATGIVRLNHTVNIPPFARLVGHLTPFALGQIHKQFQKTKNPEPLSTCMRTYSRSMGLLCAHMIETQLEVQDFISLDSVHQQWRITERQEEPIDPVLLIQNPAPVQP